MVSSAADLVFAALGLDDPTLELLSRANDLEIKARAADGKAVESILAEYEAVKDKPAEAGLGSVFIRIKVERHWHKMFEGINL